MKNCRHLHAGPTPFNGASAIPAPRWRQRKNLLWKISLFVPVFVLVLAPFIGAILFIPKTYYSAGTIIIGDQEPNAGVPSPAWVQKLGDPADLESQLIIIRSRRMLRLALSKPGVLDAVQRECMARRSTWLLGGPAPDCKRLGPSSPDLLTYVEARYSVDAVGRSRVVAIGYQSPIPEVSMMMANALLVSYLEDQRSSAVSGRNSIDDWILEQAKSAGSEADPSDSKSDAAQRRLEFFADLEKTANDLEAERRTLVSRGRLVSLAEPPQTAAFPKRVPILAAGVTLAFLIAGFVSFKRDQKSRDWSAARLARSSYASRKTAFGRNGGAHPE